MVKIYRTFYRNVPLCLRAGLEARQVRKLNRWIDTVLRKPTLVQHDEAYGGATMTSSIYFIIQETGICTEIKAVSSFSKQECDLTIDDDNKLDPLPKS